MNNDEQHLRLLVIGHYVGAAITALFASIPLIHFTIGLILTLHPPQSSGDERFVLAMIGLIFAFLGGMVVLSGWAFAICIFMVGRSIAARKQYTFCIVIAAVCCAFIPFGTLLGVFTLLVLFRPSVKAMFSQPATPESSPASAPQPGAWRDDSFVGRSDS